MSFQETIDVKLFNIPKVVMQNLSIEPPEHEEPVMSDLCKLPKVHLEKLDLEIKPKGVTHPEKLVPKVCVVKLDLDFITQQNSTISSSKSSVSKPLTKVPIVLLQRCDKPKRLKKRVSFSLPRVDHTYTIVGPHRNVPLKECSVQLTRDDLQKLAAQKVEKPSFCKLCHKVYYSKKKLLYHQERKHDLVTHTPIKKKRVSFSDKVIVHTMPYHRCRKCLKIFETYKILKFHMRSQHRKRDKYICDYCEKIFADRTIFKVHIKLHCDVCTELFNEKRQLLQHKKSECAVRKVRKIKCANCDDVYFSNLCLKDHSYTHQNKKFVCDICKEHYMTKCNMIRHLIAHGNEDDEISCQYTCMKTGSLKIYTCQFCFESFIDEREIGEHLKIDEGLENNCGYCGLRFTEQEQLLKHMWNHVNTTLDLHEDVAIVENGDKKIEHKKSSANVNPSVESAKSNPSVQVERLKLPVENHAPKSLLENKQPAVESTKSKPSVKVAGSESSIENNGTKSLINNAKSRPNGINSQLNENRNGLPVKDKEKKRKKNIERTHFCGICNKSFTRRSDVKRHQLIHLKEQHGSRTSHQSPDSANRCQLCEETFAWPALLRDHTCLRTNHYDSVEVPIVSTEIYNTQPFNSFPLDEDLPATNDLSAHVDFDIPTPTPTFEFASVAERLPDVYAVSPAADARSYRYKVVRQEVPIEF